MPHIVFVCSGNVFRSLSAQLALQSVAPPGMTAASAGCWTRSEFRMRSDIRERLAHWGADCSAHAPRQLTKEIMDGADLVVALNHDHQAYIERTFGRRVPLYMEIATGNPDAFPDLPDIVPDYKNDRDAARVYVNRAIDAIFGYRDAFVKNLPAYLPPPRPVRPAPAPAP
jgi:protein-tyrosine-phosphatase